LQKYALDFKALVAIEIVVLAIFEYKRYSNFKKYGQVRAAAPAPRLLALPLLRGGVGAPARRRQVKGWLQHRGRCAA
jgi:hypothetical protein